MHKASRKHLTKEQKVERTRINKQIRAQRHSVNEQEQGITSLTQCYEVQRRRVKSGKNGYSKAVRKFLLFISHYHYDYQEQLSKLPVRWDYKKPIKTRAANPNREVLLRARAMIRAGK